MSKKIRIKAAKDAPESVSHGNFDADNVNGYFETENRKFADHIINSGYGKEVNSSPKPKVKSPKSTKKATAKPKPAEKAPEAPAAAADVTAGGTE